MTLILAISEPYVGPFRAQTVMLSVAWLPVRVPGLLLILL